jgi:hypothetical protein
MPTSLKGSAYGSTELDGVLHKLVDALRDDGAMLLSHPVGQDECWEHAASGDYRVVRWSSAALDERLRRSGLVVAWDKSEDGDEGPWRSVLCYRLQAPDGFQSEGMPRC